MYYHGVVVVFVFVQISDALSVPWQLVACLLLDSIFISYFLSLLVCLYNSYLFVVLWLDSSFFVIVCVDRCCWSCADSVSRICFVWVAVAQLASICPVSYFFPETSGSMGLLFITRWDLHPSLSNQLKCYKDSIKCQIHQWMPHSSSVAKQNECILFLPSLLFLAFTHFEWEITPNGASNKNYGDQGQQIENNFGALIFV